MENNYENNSVQQTQRTERAYLTESLIPEKNKKEKTSSSSNITAIILKTLGIFLIIATIISGIYLLFQGDNLQNNPYLQILNLNPVLITLLTTIIWWLGGIMAGMLFYALGEIISQLQEINSRSR